MNAPGWSLRSIPARQEPMQRDESLTSPRPRNLVRCRERRSVHLGTSLKSLRDIVRDRKCSPFHLISEIGESTQSSRRSQRVNTRTASSIALPRPASPRIACTSTFSPVRHSRYNATHPCAVRQSSSVICHLSSAICHPPSAICHLPSVIDLPAPSSRQLTFTDSAPHKLGIKRPRLGDVVGSLDDRPAVGEDRELVALGGEPEHERVVPDLAQG